MKKSTVIATAIGALFASSAFAEDKSFTSKINDKVSIEVGIGKYNETYTEYDMDGAKYMMEEANMTALSAKLHANWNVSTSSRFTMEYAFGESDYTGAYWGGAYGSLTGSGIDRKQLTLHGDARFSPAAWNGFGVAAGLGVRKLRDSLQQMSSGGYQRDNQLIYATIAVDQTFQLGKRWTVSPEFTYKHLLKGTQKSDMTGGSVSVDQKRGNGYDVSFAFKHLDSVGAGVAITPYLRTWDIAASETATVNGQELYEPKNKTKEVGVKVSWIF